MSVHVKRSGEWLVFCNEGSPDQEPVITINARGLRVSLRLAEAAEVIDAVQQVVADIAESREIRPRLPEWVD